MLEKIDQRTTATRLAKFSAEQMLLADECARRAIDICLTAESLDNLERARLLDILLWCGEIARPALAEEDGIAEGPVRRQYEKPELKRLAGKPGFLS